jgi:hypothetical protein
MPAYLVCSQCLLHPCTSPRHPPSPHAPNEHSNKLNTSELPVLLRTVRLWRATAWRHRFGAWPVPPSPARPMTTTAGLEHVHARLRHKPQDRLETCQVSRRESSRSRSISLCFFRLRWDKTSRVTQADLQRSLYHTASSGSLSPSARCDYPSDPPCPSFFPPLCLRV